MFWVYFGLYTLFLVIAWGFFIVVRLHALKFKNFSHNIENITTLLFITLIIFSLVGYGTIFFLGTGENPRSATVNTQQDYKQIDY